MQIILLLSLLNFGFSQDSILIRAGTNTSEIENFISVSEQKGYLDWAEFLLSAMPDVDLVNLQSDDFIAYFDALKKNYERVPWKNQINSNLFYYYILPHRVSQEPLENFTAQYADELYNLVQKTKRMQDAVYKINEWVYTKMVYEPTEPWDQNATTTIKRGIGRCEEMSILFIKALRTVCIPSRHTYTPWWSYTNGNHAWVEIWIDGKWHSLGGGELTDLDHTWFATPAKRTAIIKSTVYGKITDSIEIIDRSENNYTIINSTPNYSDVANLFIQVKKDNLPQESASVSINVYNYASLVPVGLKKTDNNGIVQWSVGKTDLFIYAHKDSQIGYYIWRPSDKNIDTVIINISKKEIPDTSFWLYTRKVTGQSHKSKYKPDIKLLNEIRDMHIAKINIVDNNLKQTLHRLDTSLTNIIKNAKANGRSLLQFYLNLPDLKRPIFVEYCKTLVSKDLVRLDTNQLFQELTAVQRTLTMCDRKIPDTIIRDYLVSPRIHYEQLDLWRLFIQFVIDENLPILEAPYFFISTEDKIDSLFNWVTEHIALKKNSDAFGPMMNPQDVYKAKHATKLEQYVFIIGALRSVGIPSRIKWSEDAVEYWDNGWQEKSFDAMKEKKNLWVGLKFEANNMNVTDKAEYYEDYSITRFKESPIRLDPPIDTINGYSIIKLDDITSYVISGWRNGFGDAYVRLKKIRPTIDTITYTIKTDLPYDIKPGDLVIREYKGLSNLAKLGVKEKDINQGEVLILIFNTHSEASVSTLNNAQQAIKNFPGKVYLFHHSQSRGLNLWYLNLLGDKIHHDQYVSQEILDSWTIKDLPSIIYLRNGKCLFWTEGLNLHLSKLIQTLQN
ncbi:MAG: transglutaminase domain-containing protein [Candidatus Latescibacteria bacterium]|nr:transglutaminase domain-containing protein [Candidatus Latescibacterota bacterium]